MSKNWELYQRKINGDIALIAYDQGVSESIDDFPQTTRVRIELSFKTPSSNGLPSEDELDNIKPIENEITAYIEKNSGAYVGRITASGKRHYYCYVSLPDGHVEGFLDNLSRKYSYRLSITVEDDPKKSGYWDDLYPTEHDWQIMQNMKIVSVLHSEGDPIEKPRRIDHWANFTSEQDAARFAERVKSEGFEVGEAAASDPESTEYMLQFSRTDIPDIETINRITLQLRAIAKKCNGEYDGWETSVEKEDS